VLPEDNMKIFNTTEELWNYCLFCPVCQDPDRYIDITVGPDEHFEIEDWEYDGGGQLRLNCSFRLDRTYKKNRPGSYTASYLIDCQQNTFQLTANGPDPVIANHAAGFEFFFHIFAKCVKCNYSYINTVDLELNKDHTISNLQMDRESAYMIGEKDKYHITLSHDRNVMMVTRCQIIDKTLEDEENVIELPLINLDFSNHTKIINKIKTLILFS
jgi:hypothetical protein